VIAEAVEFALSIGMLEALLTSKGEAVGGWGKIGGESLPGVAV
jgi:hypothetical protein